MRAKMQGIKTELCKKMKDPIAKTGVGKRLPARARGAPRRVVEVRAFVAAGLSDQVFSKEVR
jgi:hypothetical protein